MSVFIELITDSFQQNLTNAVTASSKSRRAGAESVRRPTRGLEIKDDTYAIIKLVKANGNEVDLIDSGSSGGKSTHYTNFILQSVSETRMEKSQIVETFGEPYIFFFGEQPRFLDVQALLIDSNDFNWYAEFWENYDRYLRGTKSVEMGARTYLFYDDNIVEGYMLQAQAQKVADQPLQARLSFRLYLTNYSNVSFVENNPNFPIRGSVALPDGLDLTTNEAYNVLNTDNPAQRNLQYRQEKEAKAKAYLVSATQNLQAQHRYEQEKSRLQMYINSRAGNPEEILQAMSRMDFLDRLIAVASIASQEQDAKAQDLLSIANSPIDESVSLRTKPLRSLIADNYDEFTSQAFDTLDAGIAEVLAGLSEAEDLAKQALAMLSSVGATGMGPSTLNGLGMGPTFRPGGIGIGAGIGVGFSAGASFGAGGGAGIGRVGGLTGIGGGLGFSGRNSQGFGFVAGGGASFRNGQTYSGTYGNLINERNATSFRDLDYPYGPNGSFSGGIGVSLSLSAGVQIGGLSTGVGIGGGVNGGLPPAGFNTAAQYVATPTGFYPVPGGLYPRPGGGFAPQQGIATLNANNAPSAFAIISVGGTLTPEGFNTQSYAGTF